MARQVLLYSRDEETAHGAVKRAGGRLMHVFTPRVFVADLPVDVELQTLENVGTTPPPDLTEIERMIAEAWESRQQRQASARLAESAVSPLRWDTPGFQPPDSPETVGKLSTGTLTSLYLAGTVAVGIVVVSGSSWTSVNGVLTSVSVGSDGTAWGVNTNIASPTPNVFQWSGSAWLPMPGYLTQISVGNAGNIWGVNTNITSPNNNVFQWSDGAWQPISGYLTNVSAGSDGTVWGVNANIASPTTNVFQWSGGAWQPVSGYLTQISVANADTIWGTNSANNVFQWNKTEWIQMPGILTGISAGFDGSVFGVNASIGGSTNDVYRWTGSAWQTMPAHLTQISAASTSNIWGVNAGLIFNGNASSGLNFTTSQGTFIVSEVMEGLNFLASAEPLAALTFYYDFHFVPVTAVPGPVASIKDPYGTMEAPWRDAALIAMGFPGSMSGSNEYVASIKAKYDTDWAYVAYFTNYPLEHPGYAGGSRTVIQYANDGWGPNQINSVFAHESCHIFGAADEYSGCGCGPSGAFGVSNGNCVSCTSSPVPCLMNANTLSLCNFSRGQIGWSTWALMPGILTSVSVGSDGTVWGVNTNIATNIASPNNNVFQWSGSAWLPMPGYLTQISVGNAGNIWGVNTNIASPTTNVFQWSDGAWQAVSGYLTNISAGSDGTVWGVNANIASPTANVFQFSSGAWLPVSGYLTNVSVGSNGLLDLSKVEAGNVWGVNANIPSPTNNVFQWTGSTWQSMTGNLTNISAGSYPVLWGVNAANQIFAFVDGVWTNTPGLLAQISAGSAKQIWGVTASGSVFTRSILATL